MVTSTCWYRTGEHRQTRKDSAAHGSRCVATSHLVRGWSHQTELWFPETLRVSLICHSEALYPLPVVYSWRPTPSLDFVSKRYIRFIWLVMWRPEFIDKARQNFTLLVYAIDGYSWGYVGDVPNLLFEKQAMIKGTCFSQSLESKAYSLSLLKQRQIGLLGQKSLSLFFYFKKPALCLTVFA